MIRLLKQWLGCEHHWIVLTRRDFFESNEAKYPYRSDYVMQCDKCGWIKTIRGNE